MEFGELVWQRAELTEEEREDKEKIVAASAINLIPGGLYKIIDENDSERDTVFLNYAGLDFKRCFDGVTDLVDHKNGVMRKRAHRFLLYSNLGWSYTLFHTLVHVEYLERAVRIYEGYDPQYKNSMTELIAFANTNYLPLVLDYYLLDTVLSYAMSTTAGTPSSLAIEERLRSRFLNVVEELESFLVKLLAITSLGEARHALVKSNFWDGAVSGKPRPIQWAYNSLLNTCPSRCEAYHAIHATYPNYNITDQLGILRYIHDIFKKYRWYSGFGGSKWARITKVLIDYYEQRYPKRVFVDTAINLTHNTRTLIDKFMGESSVELYIDMLNVKAHMPNIVDLIEWAKLKWIRIIPYLSTYRIPIEMYEGFISTRKETVNEINKQKRSIRLPRKPRVWQSAIYAEM